MRHLNIMVRVGHQHKRGSKLIQDIEHLARQFQPKVNPTSVAHDIIQTQRMTDLVGRLPGYDVRRARKGNPGFGAEFEF